MRCLLFALIGFFICLFWIHPSTIETPVLHDREHFVGRADSIQIWSGRIVKEKPAAKFPDEIARMFHEIVPNDYGSLYHEPDSGNTHIYWLNVWSENEVVLIETSAGYTGGSCGWNIMVCAYDSLSSRWNIIMEDCGSLDTVHDVSHNGLLDFSVNYRWSPTSRYVYDGRNYVALEEKHILSDSEQVAKLLGESSGYGDYLDFTYEMHYLVLDSTKNPYIVAWEGAMERCLIHEEKPGEFKLINKFVDAVQIDVLNKKHYSMPDIRTVCWDMTNVYYRWNGSKYVEYYREERHCPA